MKIIKNKHSSKEYFSKIDFGEIIEENSDLYLVIDSDEDNFNAVNIRNGKMRSFEEFDLVIHHKNAELVVNN